MSWLYHQQKRDSALFLAEKALALAIKYKNEETLFIATIQLAEIHRTNKRLSTAKQYLDTATRQLHTITSSVQKGRYYLCYGKLAYNTKDYTLAQQLLHKAYALAHKDTTALLIDIYIYQSKTEEKKKNYIKAENYLNETLVVLKSSTNFSKRIQVLNTLGNLKARQQQYIAAKEYYEQSLELAKIYKDIPGQSRACLNIGNIFYYQGNWTTAISFYLESSTLKELVNDKKGIAKIHNNIAAIYKQQKRYQESLAYYIKSETYFIAEQDSVKLAETWINKAIVTIFLKEPKEALHLLHDALSIIKQYNLPKTELIAESNIAFAYSEIGNYHQALNYLTIAEKKANALQKKYSIVFITNLYGACYFKLKEYAKAIQYYERSYNLSTELGILNEQKKALFGLYETEKSLKNHHRSLQWYETYTQLKDSLFNTESTTKLIELQEKYEAKQKEQEIHHLSIAHQKVSLENTLKTNQLKFSILGILIGILAIVIISLLFYHHKKTQKDILIRTKEKNKEQLNQLIQQQEISTLETILLTQQEERKKLAKDIHDNLGSYLATLTYQHEVAKPMIVTQESKTQFELMSQLLGDAYAEVRSISHRMATGEELAFSLFNAISETIHRIQNTKQFNIQFHHLSETLQLPQATELILYKIIQELLSNVLKHAQATEVTIQINNDQENVILMVEDNGKGFDTTMTNQGIGLVNITERVIQLRGQLDINSCIGQGTTIVVLVPIPQNIHT